MTVTAFSEPSICIEQSELESANTLQELHCTCAAILERYQIQHAVLLYMPSPTHSLTLQLLPIDPSLKDILAKAVSSNAHPAVRYGKAFRQPQILSEFRSNVSNEPIVTQLMTAFRKAGMLQVYELPLPSRNGVRFVLEVARVEHPIGHAELSQLQSVASIIPGKLPEFLIKPTSSLPGNVEFRIC